MRIFRWVSLLVVVGCTEPPVHRCQVDDDCHRDATCVQGHCIFDPLPRLRAVPSADRARVGEVVIFHLGDSVLPAGAPEVRLEPEGAAEVLSPGPDGSPRIRMVRPHTSVGVTLVARSPAGRGVSQSLALAPRNSAPFVRLVAPESLQPGELVEFRAEVSDADGDAFSVEWTYDGAGDFAAEGLVARIRLPAEDVEGEHRLGVRADDGLDAGEASTAFRPGNRPPVVEGIVVPGAVEHHCNEVFCGAQARLVAVVRDAGPLTYDWHFRFANSSVTASFEGVGPNPLLLLSAPRFDPLAGTYPVEVVVRDAEGAIATATAEVSVANRPPLLRAHEGRPLPHAVVGEGRYLWYREPGAVSVWSDPDGDPPRPGSVRWSSPDPSVRFLDPESLDPRIEIEGGSELLGKKVPIAVEAEDINGARVSAEAILELGNRPPVVGYSFTQLFPTINGGYMQILCFDVADPDGDPIASHQLALHPREPAASFDMTIRLDNWPCSKSVGFEVRCPAEPCPAKGSVLTYVFRAEDALGASAELELAVPWSF